MFVLKLKASFRNRHPRHPLCPAPLLRTLFLLQIISICHSAKRRSSRMAGSSGTVRPSSKTENTAFLRSITRNVWTGRTRYKRVNEQMEGLHAVFAGRVWDVEGCEQLEELNATIRIVETYIGRLDAAIRGREENHERFFETGESRQTFCGTCGARPTMCSGPVPSR